MKTSDFHKKFILCLLVLLLLITPFTQFSSRVEANGSLLLSAYDALDPPTMDGNIGSTEWADADTVTFGPITVGAQSITGTLYMMNDGIYLFMAVKINGDDDLTIGDATHFLFDNDNGGETSHEDGDDGLFLYGTGSNYDTFYRTASSNFELDTDYGGSSETNGGTGRQGSENHFEISHPLDTSDDAHDFSLSNDDIVGFCLHLWIDGNFYDLPSYGLGTAGNPSTYADYQVLLPILSAFSPKAPTIDGIMGAGEWDAADSISFNLDGHVGTLYVMNDATNIYFLLKVTDDDTHTSDYCRINFDNDNGGGSLVTGDDCITCDNAALIDFYYDSGVLSNEDTSDGGTKDGEGAGSQDGSNTWYFEFSHPLDSADNSHDFSLSIGDTVGFCIYYWDFYSGGSDWYYWPDTYSNADDFGDIIIAKPVLSSGAGAPTIDGIMGAGEWDAADSISFNLDGHVGTLYVMNDATNLYILVTMTDDDTHGSDWCRIMFDNDNGGGTSLTIGDDGVEIDSSTFNDIYYAGSGPGFNDDPDDGGTSDGEGAANQDGSNTWYFEFSHPLDSADNSHDFSLSIGNTVGFNMGYGDYYTGGNDYWFWPSLSYGYADYYGDIIIASPRFVGMLNFDDYANRMGSMPGVEPSTTLYFPHFHRDSSWQTFYALVNPGTSGASIDITYYASDGSTIDTESFVLNAGHKTGKFTPSGSGWIKVVSSQPIVGMLNFDDYRNRMGSMPGVTTSTTLYFPHFDQGSSWQSYGVIANPGSTATVTTTFYANDGSIMHSGTDSVSPNCKIGGFPPTGTGWIKVESSVPVVGMLNFDDYSNRMGSMPGSTTSYAIYYPHFHQDSNWQTYYAIVNSGPDCGLTSAYYASDGSSAGSTSMSLPENNKAGTFPSSGSGWINAPP